MLLAISIALLYYLLEGYTSPQTSKVQQSVNIKFKSLSYQALLSHYPYYEPIFDDSETNNGVAIQDIEKSSDEIARALVEKQLDSYSNTKIKNEKIDEYKIHIIKIIKEVENGAVFSALYSVKVNASDSRWSSGALKHLDMWEVGKRIYASYYKENGQFVLNIIGPNAITYYESAQKPNDSEIATNLFVENYLEPNFLPEKSDGSRLLQYKINHVNSSQNDDYLFHFVYSVQGVEGKTNWGAGSGEIGENGWMNQKSISLKIQRYGDFYEGIVTGP
jgi:hypothetical protein